MPRSRIHNIIEHGTQHGNVCSNTKYSKELIDEMSKFKHGEILALNVLVEKLRTFDEVIALQALNMLEYCAEHAGILFENEIGRNRFLNELAKMLSPKYDADKCPLAVKKRISIIFYEWNKMFPNQPKISTAYSTLHSKGYILDDAIKIKKKINEPNVLGDNGASKKLERLLRSNHPDDLVLANRLIKNMVEKEENRTINIHNRKEKIQSITEKIQLLRDMMKTYLNGTSKVEIDVIKDIRNVCQEYHSDLNNIADSAIADKDPYLKDLIDLSDELTRVLNEYQDFESKISSKNLLDLDDIFGPGVSITEQGKTTDQPKKLDLGEQELKQATAHSLIDEDFLDLFTSKDVTNGNNTQPSIALKNESIQVESIKQQKPDFFVMQTESTKKISNNSLNNDTLNQEIIYNSSGIKTTLTSNQSSKYSSALNIHISDLNQPISNESLNSTHSTISTLQHLNIEMSSIDIVKSVPLTGSKLIVCLAQAKLKPNDAKIYNPSMRLYVFSGMNMTTSTISDISLLVTTTNNNEQNIKLFPLSQNSLSSFNPMLPPSVFTSILVVTDKVPIVNFHLHYIHSDYGPIKEVIPAALDTTL